MIKIIKRGTKPVTYLKIVCKDCGCEALLTLDETKKIYRGGFQERMNRCWTEYEVICPCCKKEFVVDEINLSTIHEPIKEDDNV